MRHHAVVGLGVCIALLAGGCASNHPAEPANVAAIAPAGQTVTGKVMSFTDSSVTLETATGNEVIGIAGDIAGRDLLMVGATIVVDVQRSSESGELSATRIRPAGGG